MPVMKVRPMGMRMVGRVVLVPVRVLSGHGLRMRMGVVAVIVHVGVHVPHPLVTVCMFVPPADEQRDGDQKQRGGETLRRSDLLSEQKPRHRRTPKRCTGEYALRSHRTDALSGCVVQRNARAIGHGPDGNCRSDGGRSCLPRRQCDSKGQVGGTGDRAFPQRAPRRRHAVDQCRQMIVDRPADARANHEQRGDDAGHACFTGQQRAGGDDTRDTQPRTASQRFMKRQGAQERGRNSLEIQEQRYRTSGCQSQCDQQEDRSKYPAQRDDTDEPRAIGAVEAHGG